MLKNVVPYASYFDTYSNSIEDIDEILTARDLVNYASLLINFCHLNDSELEDAIQKAILVCSSSGLSPQKHFRTIYVCSGDKLQKDWLVSNLAFQLIMLNADVSNPIIAQLQVKVLTNQAHAHSKTNKSSI